MTALPLPPALRAAAAGLRALEAAAGLIIAQASCYILEAPAIPGPDSSIGVRLAARTGGGRVATALVTVCRLGHDASLIGQVSNDDIGRAITDELRTEGVSVDFLDNDTGQDGPQSFIIVLPRGERTILCHDGELSPLRFRYRRLV